MSASNGDPVISGALAANFRTPATILRDNAGALISRKCRATRTIVTLYDGESAGMDTSDGCWQTVCEDHGMIICHKTKAAALSYLSHPDEWCDVCAGHEPNLNQTNPQETK